MSRFIPEEVKRKLYAESMGRCMNPNCLEDLFKKNGDIIEKAHITAYSETAKNTFENLLILCPNCHTEFDKNNAFTKNEVLNWKKKRNEEFDKIFTKKFDSFLELKRVIKPLLIENQEIFESYYIGNVKKLWDRFKGKILSNNRQIKTLLNKNINLFQYHADKTMSNKYLVRKFIMHIEEFEATRADDSKIRKVLFPKEIKSLFGLEAYDDKFSPSVESLEELIKKLNNKGVFEKIEIGVEKPYIQINEYGTSEIINLDDVPRIRQLHFDNNSFRTTKVRLDSLNFAVKVVKSNGLNIKFPFVGNLREFEIKNKKFIFIYEYCLSEVELRLLAPKLGTIVVNLHSWNEDSSISKDAYELARGMGVKLLTAKRFYGFLRSL